MSRLFLVLVALLLPLQFGWSAASAYCQHERSAALSEHFGHHFHVHQGESKDSAGSQTTADGDCASCHAVGAAALPMDTDRRDFSVPSQTSEARFALSFASAPTRVPDRPRWLPLV